MTVKLLHILGLPVDNLVFFSNLKPILNHSIVIQLRCLIEIRFDFVLLYMVGSELEIPLRPLPIQQLTHQLVIIQLQIPTKVLRYR